jgi:hypothetical protein
LVTEPAAALAVSGDARPEDKDMDALMGEFSVGGDVVAGAAGIISGEGVGTVEEGGGVVKIDSFASDAGRLISGGGGI